MATSIRISAPCKINLHLRVLGIRDDGYHGIESVFQLISLADELSVSIGGDRGSCPVISPRMELPRENTLTKAVDQFRLETGITDGLRVEIEKRVPAGAGLGGGSSDAAFLLKALDRLFDTGLSREAMCRMAAAVGSDVPFFMSAEAAVVTGRGECVTPIASRRDLFGVLVWPDVHCSTREAYSLVDDWIADGLDSGRLWPRASELEGLYTGFVSGWSAFGNSFTAPVEAKFPEIRRAREAIEAQGAIFSAMTGSGSSVFGLFDGEKEANAACLKLSTQWVYCVKFLLLASL